MDTGDLIFSILMGLGFIICWATVIQGMRLYRDSIDDSDFVVNPAFWPGIVGFSVFPLINTLIGVVLVFYWVKFLRR